MTDTTTSSDSASAGGKINGAKQTVKKAAQDAGVAAKAQLGKVQEQAAQLTETAKVQLGKTGEKAGELAQTAKAKAVTTGEDAVAFAKRKPVTTALAFAGVGVVLGFLLSSRARGAVVGAGVAASKAASQRARDLNLNLDTKALTHKAKAQAENLTSIVEDLGADLVKAYKKRF